MADAGVDVNTFKPHSTSAAAASKAKNVSVPIKEILYTAGWSSERTFALCTLQTHRLWVPTVVMSAHMYVTFVVLLLRPIVHT